MMPARLFDRLFGACDSQWINRKRSILDAVREVLEPAKRTGNEDQTGFATSVMPAAAVSPGGLAGGRGYEGLAADCEIAKRSAGGCGGVRVDARGVLYIDEVPEAFAICLGIYFGGHND